MMNCSPLTAIVKKIQHHDIQHIFPRDVYKSDLKCM